MTVWTEDRQAELQRLADDGLSASEIGKKLDCSRNAVIGRAYRTDVQLQGAWNPPIPVVNDAGHWFPNAAEASRYIDRSDNSVALAVKNGWRAGGYRWRYAS